MGVEFDRERSHVTFNFMQGIMCAHEYFLEDHFCLSKRDASERSARVQRTDENGTDVPLWRHRP